MDWTWYLGYCRAILLPACKEKTGQDKYSTEVVLQGYNSSLTMLGGKSSGEKNEQTISSIPDKSKSNDSDLDDEIPPF